MSYNLLNDRVIDAVNQLIGQQLEQLDVTSQSTVLSQSATGYDAVTDTMMILYAPGHWVTVMSDAKGV